MSMNLLSPIAEIGEQQQAGGRLKLEIMSQQQRGAEVESHGFEFRSALTQRMKSSAGRASAGEITGEPGTVGNSFANRAKGLASEMQKDQQAVSRQLEQATRTGDSVQLVKAMMSLNDYQLKVQTVSKVVSKGFAAFDQLTKLQ